MGYILEVTRRLNLQVIREFLLNGTECLEIITDSYEERLENAQIPIFDLLKEKFSESSEEFESFSNGIYAYANEVQNVYMELGIQWGMSFADQMKIQSVKYENV